MINLNTNLSSLIAQQSLSESTNKLNQAIERMSTGFKINHASDNAANYSISTNMTTKIGAYQVAEENAAMGLDLLATADGTLSQISDKLSRLRALAEQAANGTYGAQSLKAIQAEADALKSEINRIYATSEYNGVGIFTSEEVDTSKATVSGFIKPVTERSTAGMTSMNTVDPAVAISSGEYSISDAEELFKFAKMANGGLITGGEFVLADDIDLTGVDWTEDALEYVGCFTGVFDGNGHVISNLTGDIGLFTGVVDAEIKNVGLENVKISDSIYSPLCTEMSGSEVSNIYATGSVDSTNYFVSGLIALMDSSVISDSYSDMVVSGDAFAMGGLVGAAGISEIKNCAFRGSVTNNVVDENCIVTGLAGHCTEATITNSDVYASISGNVGQKAMIACNKFDVDIYNMTIENCNYDGSISQGIGAYTGDLSLVTASGIKDVSTLNKKYFQIGIDSTESSGLNIDTYFMLTGLGSLDITSKESLAKIDDMLLKVSSKQTEIGAMSNRLESVIDEIGIQYDNLVSSRSTIRDADIAEVSAEYIQQQILQQASATLLATANQSPSIALQLI